MKIKRLLALWLTAALLSGGLSAHGAETGEKVNLFQNSGFEKMTTEKGQYDDFGTGKPNAWGSFNGWTDDTVNNQSKRTRLTKENPHSGSYCTNIRLPADVNNAPSVSQTVQNLVPGGIYEIGFHARSPKYASEFFLQITFYKNGEMVRTQNMLRTLPSPAWKEYKLQFPFPEDADSMLVLFKLGGYGDIYLDDVFLYKVSDKPVYTLETDAVFYYSDDPTPCVATVYAVSEEVAKVSFVLKNDRNKEVLRKDGVSFSEKKAIWEFPLECIEKEKKGYTLEAYVEVNGETTLLTETVYRYKRPSRLRSDGVYLKDGQPFMPVIAHGINADQLAKCKEAGINVVTISYWYADYETDETRIKKILKQVKDNGLMAIVGLYRKMVPAGSDYNLSNTTRVVMAIDADPELKSAVYAYSMMDEPLQNDAWCDAELEAGYKLIRDLDNDIPVLTVDCSNKASVTKRNISYCDIYSCDAYYTGNGPLSSWPGEMVKLAADVAAEGNRTVYHLTQAFEWLNRGTDDCLPTSAEIRHMIYQAFLNGAKGVGYYTISDSVYKRDENGEFVTDANGNKQQIPLYESDLWQGLCAFGTGDLPIAAEHFVLGMGTKISDVDGEGHTGRIWERDGKAYVLLLSESETENKTVSVSLPYQTCRLSAYGKAPHALIENGKIEYTLSPRECMLFICEEIGVMHFFRADGTLAESPKKGETIRAEVLTDADAAVSVPLLAAYSANELSMLDVLAKSDAAFADEWTCTFEVPADGLTYKAFLWDDMKP